MGPIHRSSSSISKKTMGRPAMSHGQDTVDEPVPPQSLFSRRRKSLPSRAHDGSAFAPAGPPLMDPASPEVISSLISSLSTISGPVQHHFDNVPRIGSSSTPASPDVYQSAHSKQQQQHQQHLYRRTMDQASSSGPGFGVTYGSPPAVDDGLAPFLHPDDAAIAPVVRMARAPSSPKSRRASGATVETFQMRPMSTGSYASSQMAGQDEEAEFGTISTEPGPRVSTANSIASSTNSGGRKSIRQQFGLQKKSSREFKYDEEKKPEALRKTNSFNDSLLHRGARRSRSSLRSMYSMADLAEETRETRSAVSRAESEQARSNGAGGGAAANGVLKANGDEDPSDVDGTGRPLGGIGSGRVIPARESSLRHSYSSSTRKRRSTRHSRYNSRDAKDSQGESGIAETTGAEAEQVARRIQELKDQQQKIKTELQTDNSPAKSGIGGTSSLTLTPTSTSTSSKPAPRPSRRDADAWRRSGSEVALQSSLAIDESAPSPAVMTGKSRAKSKTGASLAVKPPNLDPLNLMQSSSAAAAAAAASPKDLPAYSQGRSKLSAEPLSPLHAGKGHKRSSSGPLSPGLMSLDERPSSSDSIDLAVFEYVSSAKLTQKVRHPTTGRMIAFSQVGDPKGHVVLCCLGMGLTRYLMAFYDELARTLNLRLITLDRPGVGESEPYQDEAGTPLSWPDDVAIVCNSIKVTKFSILAHSAGAIYALATALRIPQHIRGRIHLLAPWIPPSQLSSIGSLKEPLPTNAVPYSQRILRALPTSLLKVANSSFMSATSASITTSLPKSPRRTRRKTVSKEPGASTTAAAAAAGAAGAAAASQSAGAGHEDSSSKVLHGMQAPVAHGMHAPAVSKEKATSSQDASARRASEERERQTDYDNRLTHKIWELATTNANPAVDLLICLERRQPIGFRYVDITRAVVIHHGTKDTRVPVENVKWLGKMMRRCEVRVLDGEGHGLMASASVMGNVLTEIAREWEDWTTVVQGRRRATLTQPPSAAAAAAAARPVALA